MEHVRHEDDQLIDRVTIDTVERWKDSELSGDEWRFTYRVCLRRKGQTVEVGFSRAEWALEFVGAVVGYGTKNDIMIAGTDMHAAVTATIAKLTEMDEFLCDQPGCGEPATVWYVRKKDWIDFSRGRADKETEDGEHYRKFCTKHKRRGDCGLDDADHNYTEVLKEQLVS